MGIKTFLENRLKRWPLLYRAAARIYFALIPVHLAELAFGTRAREREWARRHLRQENDWYNTQCHGDDDWIMGYWDSHNHSHRQLIVDKITAYQPFDNILEIGCNCGPNLHLIAKTFPEVEAQGIDVNTRAIQKGNELFALENISNVKLSAGKANRLEHFPDKSFDIILTDAVLIYIGPDQISQVIKEMLRIARKVLILVERHRFKPDRKDPHGLGVYYRGLWLRDYAAIFEQLVPANNIQVTKITEEVWPEWKDEGAVIEVTLPQ